MIEHHLVRATVLPEIIRLIANHEGCSEEEALSRFYTSTTGSLYSDDDSGLYGQSPLFVFSLYCKEADKAS